MRASTFLCAGFLFAVLGPTATASHAAARYSGLKHPCHYRYGVGEYQDVSYDGFTNCGEAGVLIRNVTNDGRRRARVEIRTGHTPHGTWRCVSIRRAEVHGVIVSDHRITCSLRDDPRGRPARVRFFQEG